MKRDHCGAPPVALIGEPRRVAGRPRIRPETWAKGSGELKKKLDSKKKKFENIFSFNWKNLRHRRRLPTVAAKGPVLLFHF